MLELRTNAAGYFDIDCRDTIAGADLSGFNISWQTYLNNSPVAGHNGTATYVGPVTISGLTCYRFRVSYTQDQALLLTADVGYRVHAECPAIGMGWDEDIVATRYAGG